MECRISSLLYLYLMISQKYILLIKNILLAKTWSKCMFELPNIVVNSMFTFFWLCMTKCGGKNGNYCQTFAQERSIHYICTVSTVFFKVVVLVIWLPFVPIRKGQTPPIGLKHPGSFGMAICYAQPKLNFPRCESSSAYFGFY